VAPERTVFIDDSEKNAEAAARCGFHAIRFTDADELRRRLAELGLVVAQREPAT
jgi:2-haloacid dehalogenase